MRSLRRRPLGIPMSGVDPCVIPEVCSREGSCAQQRHDRAMGRSWSEESYGCWERLRLVLDAIDFSAGSPRRARHVRGLGRE